MIMLIHKKTGIQFTNRKEAKSVIGQGRYNRLCKNNEFEFIEEDILSKNR